MPAVGETIDTASAESWWVSGLEGVTTAAQYVVWGMTPLGTARAGLETANTAIVTTGEVAAPGSAEEVAGALEGLSDAQIASAGEAAAAIGAGLGIQRALVTGAVVIGAGLALAWLVRQ